ncbi:hypothetical protein G7L40_02105 [Paenibacillus polymyxa]|uniref:Phage minor structural protein, region n=1 Tax=Paenibacillus polymyxa TaxID=1406 RepID=A0A378XTW5_PAEPO|nr:hypothetical protein [Paenibacillus polymyxa]MBE7897496.1 hypothetical protein [Paenibacillus polymyxa]MCC3257253.1 hypothetical protein [Paenibacillus polymyxa]QPK51622.1 hypothetical protein G7035_02100 [Paenibacillus polymyxa]QPK56710.1 hypothetical protein G7L40_02105 [Paenibacillus polymyxa]UOD87855.1 hypothetical protein CUU60_22705 [Paenibacillus polymyxa ATCC 842]
MSFSSKLPEWFATGLEPNASQKLTGYQVGIKPPAQWFNWHLNTAYLAMKELQENAVHKEEIESRFNTINTKTVTLNAGVQILNAVKAAPFSLSGVTGRMLVNLLGRMGNCESVGLWSSNTTIATDTANKTSGTSSFKITLGSVPATASVTFLTTPGRKYIAIADVKNGNSSKIAISINGIAGATGNEVSSASVFAPSVVRFAATDYFHILTITGTGNSGGTFNMDSVRVYEISDADYAAAATLTPAQVAAKWPYVDSVMPVRNPYAIRYGENLLPSFYEWSAKQGTPTIANEKSVSVTVDNKIVHTVSPLVPGQKYTVSVQSGGATGRITVTDEPESAIVVEASGSGLLSATFTATSRAANIRLLGTSSTAVTMSNPMLNIGSTAKPFKPREDSMLALQTDLYADPVTGANADTVFERDGQYFKSKKWQGLTIDGNRAWVLGDAAATAGVRQVKIVGLAAGAVAASGIATKFDGKIMPQGSTGNTADTNAVTAAGDIYIGISVADSGWDDKYSPSQDDIKAYFFGYKAYDANTITPAQAQAATTATWNGTGTKYWVQRVGAPNFTQSVPTQSYAGYTPYQLVYQLATPTVEPIVSEGQLSFVEGDNQVEVGTGIVLREKAKMYQELGTKGWNINNGSPGEYQSSLLNYRVDRFIGIYRNSQRDSWTLYPNTVTPAGALAQSYNVDTAAAYTVSYLAFMSSPVVPFTGSYAANEKTLLADLVDSVQQNTARVSVLENKKADKDNPAWITPTTLLNGWVSMGVLGYRKKDNIVQVKARIKSGVIGQPFMILPEGYRPLVGQVRPVHSYTTTDVFAAVLINADGKFIVSGGSNNEVNIYLEFTLD